MKQRLLSWLVYFTYRLLAASWRTKVVVAPGLQAYLNTGKPVIFAHWHGDELAIIQLVRRFGLATMTSTSKDGSIVDFAILKLGGATARGSSTRGGVSALKGLIRLVKGGRNASFAVDGPRGPIHEPKPGVFEVSRICSAPIIATGVRAKPIHIFRRSWNKAYLPLPSDRASIKDQRETMHLKAALDAAGQEAAKIIAAT